MSLYSEYLTEKTNDEILETENGFATYRFIQFENIVYIIDIYVRPSHRKTGLASAMADEIAIKAKKRCITKMIGSVVPSAKNSDESIKVLQAYGMKLKSATNDFIIFEKDLV